MTDAASVTVLFEFPPWFGCSTAILKREKQIFSGFYKARDPQGLSILPLPCLPELLIQVPPACSLLLHMHQSEK